MHRGWFPDETVFSFCARYRVLSGHRLSAETTLDLFRHARLGSAHDFPCRIDRFCARMDGQMGTSEEVIRQHTILPFYLPFVSAEKADLAVRTLRGDSIGSLKFVLGLLTSGFRAAHPLKACAECMNEDADRFSVAYWRVSHQLPGAWYCIRHKTPLLLSRQKINGVQRFNYMLPANAELYRWDSEPSILPEQEDAPGMLLARVVSEIWSALPGEHYSLPTAAPVYSNRIVERGFVKRSGRPNLQSAAASFLDFCISLRRAPDSLPLPSNETDSHRWLSRILQSPKSGMHPLRHATTITWLFGSFEAFRKQYRYAAITQSEQRGLAFGASGGRVVANADNAVRQSLLERVRSGLSVRKASMDAGVSIQTGLAWAAESGIDVERRPSKLLPEVHAELVSAALAGNAKEQIESDLGISRTTLNRAIRSVPGLAAKWRAAQGVELLAAHRAQWLAAINDHPTLGAKALRLIEEDLYAWLYRHDRQWLLAITPRDPICRHHAPRVQWDARDVELASAVRVAALELSQERPGARIQLRHLRERVHSLTPQLSNLHRLPLTLKAIVAAMQRRKEA